jgi:hypothetical protein
MVVTDEESLTVSAAQATVVWSRSRTYRRSVGRSYLAFIALATDVVHDEVHTVDGIPEHTPGRMPRERRYGTQYQPYECPGGPQNKHVGNSRLLDNSRRAYT